MQILPRLPKLIGLRLLTSSIVSILTMGQAYGAYYDTLPKGVRMLALRQIQTSTIKSAFNRQQQEQEYFFKVNLDAKSLVGIDDTINAVFEQVKSISPEAYEQLTFGEYQARGEANVKVNGGGLAYGVNNRLTVYGTFPWYNAQVNLDIRRSRQNNYQQVADQLRASGDSTAAQVLSQIAPDLPDINGGVVQSVVVNYLNYQPLGNWQAEGMGDMELGFFYRLTDWDAAGIALSGGVVLPTGREDDPDILQDFAFGDGQTDLFAEIGGGFRILNTNFSYDTFSRYTYQFAHNRVMRVAESAEYPYGSQNAEFQEKLGNMIDHRSEINYMFKRWLSFGAGYHFNYIGQADYNSQYELANRVNALETERTQHTLRSAVYFSTVPLYKSGDFFLPFNASFTTQHIVGGLNTPKYNRYDLEFRFFF